ncbi:MAG: SDR family NAD(P)-dependent oxidoreductase [Oscillospiraceae bacterium]|nr:SDR family NAD(P)-dependent oxidoreductase [Oscillospiraceae bacterium]
MKMLDAFPPQHQNRQPGLEYIMKPSPVSECNRQRRKLEGKVAVITGGDSGIGRAVAYDFMKEGASVAIVYYNEDKDAEDTAEKIRQLGSCWILIKGDLKDPEFVRDCIQKTIERFGGLDILVNNHAIQFVQRRQDRCSIPTAVRSYRIIALKKETISPKRRNVSMFKHEKTLFRPVGVEKPNPQYAALLQEQLGGANGELKAAMQYMSQSFRIKDQSIKDLFLDIAAEELGHMEMVAQTINLLNGQNVDAVAVPAGEVQSHVLLGLNPGLINASGYSWTGDYVTVTGDLCADLLSNIASEQRAKVVYEYLYRQIDDKKVRETIDFLLNREEAHNAMFREAFNKVQDTGSNRDFGTTKAAKMYFSMSEPSPVDSPFPNANVAPPSFDNDRSMTQ